MQFQRLWLPGLALLSACSGRADEFDRPYVSKRLEERSGFALALDEAPLPPGISLSDGVSEDEAVAIALWRNAAFAEALAELGLRRADIQQAGMLPNPVFSLLYPLGPKQMEFALKVPLEALWLRPSRVAAAEADAEHSSALLVQAGLDLIAEVRNAFSEHDLSLELGARAFEAVWLREQLEQKADLRFRAGETGEQDLLAARSDLLQARRQEAQHRLGTALARERLRALLGFAQDPAPLEFVPSPRELRRLQGDRASRLKEALASRPDVRAAEFAIEAAGERAGLASTEYLALSGILDANVRGSRVEAGPGMELPLPLFNQNQAGKTRAEAEVERAARRYVTIRDKVTLEVNEAELEYARAVDAVREAEQERIPVEAAVSAALRAHEAGETSVIPVRLAQLRRTESGARLEEAGQRLRRARTRLERCVGRRLE